MLFFTRAITEEEERPVIKDLVLNNCTKARHVLCETNTLIVQKFQYQCLSKPQTLDLPALISIHLTHELCLSVCQELQTKLAILHIDKCYCLNGVTPHSLNITADFKEFKQEACGNVCSGIYIYIIDNEFCIRFSYQYSITIGTIVRFLQKILSRAMEKQFFLLLKPFCIAKPI